MREKDLLDLIERALRAADHPEVTGVKRFDHGAAYGVTTEFQSGAKCFLSVADASGKLLPSGGGR
ncbi:hypothetical protein [Catellatospora methionotrophica]|uniref:hypothetical protein n=1 Tax=Catellatospora methionotrophica TaxID=121620 RepID=UPI0033C388A7